MQNKTNGRAVADIKGVFILKHSDCGNQEPNVMKDAIRKGSPFYHKWFPLLTLRGTVNSSQDAPSIEKINVDQFDAPIGITTEPGDFNFEASIPSMTYWDVMRWLGNDVALCYDENGDAIVDENGRQFMGENLNGDLYDCTVMILTRSNNTIVFSHAQLSMTFSKEDKVFTYRISGSITAPENSENRTLYVSHDAPAIKPTALTLTGEATMDVGDKQKLTLTSTPTGVPVNEVMFDVDDAEKAYVSADGTIEALVAGTAKVTAKSKVNPEIVSAQLSITIS